MSSANPRRRLPHERSDGSIAPGLRKRDGAAKADAAIAAHQVALAPRRWVPPAERPDTVKIGAR